MNRRAKGIYVVSAAMLLVAGMCAAASAFSLRVPQVVVQGGSLQGYLNSQGESINVNTDQVDAQVWSTTASGNSVFTLMIEYAGYANSNNVGVYNSDEAAPTLFQIFPGSASPGWHALISFPSSGFLIVTLFDENSNVITQTSYPGVHRNSFGFYLQGPGGLFYSQDGRNAGAKAQMVTYAGTGLNSGDWWLCFEDLAPGVTDDDFEDAVLVLESVNPVKTAQTTLGQLKALYRR
ncbi:MAG TPA: hypothetical protein VJS69_08485 [Candidatus Krumholzibacteria bacterium]|nr:hypothetical protein [Candidatus Krumholzibacteria bacterium]